MGARGAILLVVGACALGVGSVLLLTRPAPSGAPAAQLELPAAAPRTDPGPGPAAGGSTPGLEPLETADVPRDVERPPSPVEPIASDPVGEVLQTLLALPEGTIAEMETKKLALQSERTSRAQPILLKRFEDGLGEHVADGNRYDPIEDESREIYALRKVPDLGWFRASLPRKDYPELYAMKDAELRLETRIQEARVEEALSRRKP